MRVPTARTGKFWTVDEAADLVRLSRHTIRRALRNGELQGGKQTWFCFVPNGPRFRRQRWMIADASLATWIEQRGLAEVTGANLSAAIPHRLDLDQVAAVEREMKLSPLIGRMLRAFHQLKPSNPRKELGRPRARWEAAARKET